MATGDDLKRTKISTRWVLLQAGLTWLFFIEAAGLSIFFLLSLLNGLQPLLSDEAGAVLFFFATLGVLLFFPLLYGWSRQVIDYLFFPDTAGFKRKIEEACLTLTEFYTYQDFNQFLTKKLPAELQVENITLHQEPIPASDGSVTFTLEMGSHWLGFLTIGPKCSRRSFNRSERAALVALQERVSLVLSGIQLAQLRAEAEKTDQLKQNFLTNVSHLLRTPLNAIINSTGLVADGVLGTLNEEQTNFLNQAVGGSEYLMSLLNDILDITRIETGQLVLQIEQVPLEEVIEDVVTMCRGMLQNRPVELRAEVAGNLLPVMADRLRVRQILFNLLSNAMKFTKEGFIEVGAWVEEDTAYICVADTGPGIAAEYLPLIFEDYTQAVATGNKDLLFQRRRYLGTGLGMSITQALVKLHSGQIWVESEEGQGATFTFTLPLASSEPAQIAMTEATDSPPEIA